MNIYLERYGSTPMGTFGEMVAGDVRCFTVERPWLNNKPFVSCIPAGEYILEPFKRPSGENAFVLLSEALGITRFEESNSARYTCLIHTANVMTDVEGCIGPGDALGFVKGLWGVLNSGLTMRDLLDELGNDTHTLTITWQKNGG